METPTYLKIIGAGSHPYPKGLEDWHEFHGDLTGISFPRNKFPHLEAGTTLAVYLAGTYRVPALVTVKTGDVLPSEEGTKEDRERWPYRLEVEPRFEIRRLSDAPTLESVGIGNKSVRSQSHIGLTPEQGQAIQREFARALGGEFRKALVLEF